MREIERHSGTARVEQEPGWQLAPRPAGMTMRDLFELVHPLAEAMAGKQPGEPVAYRAALRVDPETGAVSVPVGCMMRPDELMNALVRRGVYTAYAKVVTLDVQL